MKKAGRWEIPIPLQHQVFIRIGLAILLIIVEIGLLFQFTSLPIALPCSIVALLLAGDALHIYLAALRGRYLVLKGTVLKVERTLFRQRAKALLLEVDGKALRVILRNRHKVPADGSAVSLFIPDNAPLYEWHGLHQLYSYFAISFDRNIA